MLLRPSTFIATLLQPFELLIDDVHAYTPNLQPVWLKYKAIMTSTARVKLHELNTQITDIMRVFDWCSRQWPGTYVQLNPTENALASANHAFFRLVRQKADGSWQCLRSLDIRDPQLIALAVDLRGANKSHMTLLRRIDNGSLRRLGSYPRLDSSDAKQEATQVVAKLDDVISFVLRKTKNSDDAWDDDWDLPEAGHAPRQALTRPTRTEEGKAVPERQMSQVMVEILREQKSQIHRVVTAGLASALSTHAQRFAAAETRWEKEIKGLKGLVDAQQKEVRMLKAKTSTSAAAEAGAKKREAEVQALREQLRAERSGKEKLEQEVRSLQDELSALLWSETPKPSAPAFPDLATKAGLDSLTRLILSSDPFATTITRLLSLTVNHTLSLSAGCFAVANPERVLQIADACHIQHSLAAPGVNDPWAGERKRMFQALVEKALDVHPLAEAEPDSDVFDQAMLDKLRGGELGDGAYGEVKAGELSAAFAEEREKIKLAWVDIVQAITTQHQLVLTEIAQHRAAATEIISAAGAEAVQAISEQSQRELLSMEEKADKLDQAMLDFGQLYPVSGTFTTAPAAEYDAPSTPSPTDQNFTAIPTLLEPFLPAQQTAESLSVPPTNSPLSSTHTTPRSSSQTPAHTTPLPSQVPVTAPAPAAISGSTVTAPRRSDGPAGVSRVRM